MAGTQRRSWLSVLFGSKRFAPASPLGRAHRMRRAAVAAGVACALATGCDGGHDDFDARGSAAGAAAMLPGTRDTAVPQAGARAQGFDMEQGAPARGASDALLPPVMHTAD